MELKARFDEESNIEWARALEAEGVHVVYGLVGLKIHCKVAMVVRREGDRIARYVHLSTGNYNAVTAHLYTDLGMFTASEEVADDVTHLFNYLTGYSAKADYKRLLVAPVNLRSRMESMIDREIEHQEKGRKGHLIFKTNALVDPESDSPALPRVSGRRANPIAGSWNLLAAAGLSRESARTSK